MKTVHEISELFGISIRTLHYYDRIDLLKPSAVTAAGYRLYDDDAIRRLQQILLFRELRFKLRDIKAILAHPDFDAQDALTEQIRLLKSEQARLTQIIFLAEQLQQKGVISVNRPVFDQSEIKEYQKEAKARWGNTAAYRESMQKENRRTERESAEVQDGLMQIFAAFGGVKHEDTASSSVQALVRQLQAYITEHYYTCTDEILHGLGQMYANDERFKATIDQAGGEGTAQFVSQAIADTVK